MVSVTTTQLCHWSSQTICNEWICLYSNQTLFAKQVVIWPFANPLYKASYTKFKYIRISVNLDRGEETALRNCYKTHKMALVTTKIFLLKMHLNTG